MSAKGLNVLNHLADAKAKGWPFVPLTAHGRTLRALFNADLIDISPGDDGARYKITARGERTRLAYLKLTNRTDGICPRCGINARPVNSAGKVNPYCNPCKKVIDARKYKLMRPTVKAGRMCSRCHKRPVHVRPSGRIITYCLHCNNLLKRHAKKRCRKHNARLAAKGIVKNCTRPGCTRPRHATANQVSELCLEHYREWHNAYRQRRRTEVQA